MGNKEFIYEDTDTEVGGGTTGTAHSAAPVAKKKAGLPNSKDQGDMSPVNIGTQVTSGLEPEETSHENNTKPAGTASSANMASLKPKSNMKEAVNALFGGSDLSEDFKNKALTIFEAAVNAQIEEVTAELEESYNQKLDEAVEAVVDELSEKVDDYLNYVADEWMKENKVEVESGLRAEMVDSFLSGLKNLFTEHYVDLPEEDESVVESLLNKVEELESRLNEEVETNIDIKKQLDEVNADIIIAEAAEDLTESQKEKFFSLIKAVSFDSIDTLTEKVSTIKESYFSAVKTGNAEQLIEELDFEQPAKSPTSGLEPNMAQYVSTLSRTLKK